MMLQGVSGLIGNSGDGGASAPSQQQQKQQAQSAQAHESGGGGGGGGGGVGGGEAGGGSTSGGFSEEDRGRIEEGERNSGGNRWPRQETLALLKIRSDMDVTFRDSSLKGPLWDEVSRKLSELGYHRSAKKCKEKFENVYKYHKRTKEGRTSKADGKTYRFFDQLEALEANPAGTHHPPLSLPAPPPAKPPQASAAMPNHGAVPVTQVVSYPPIGVSESHQNNVNPISVAAPAVAMPGINHVGGFPFSHPNMSGSTDSEESSTSSDSEPPERRRKRKRKWKDFFGRLMKEVIDKQEEMQMKFLDTLERRERDRLAREEAWRVQEMAKMNREHELLVQERSIAAAKDAAVITFLQKLTEQNPNVAQQMPPLPMLQQQLSQPAQPAPAPAPPPPVIQQKQPQQQPPPPPQPQPTQTQQQQYPASVPIQVQPVAVAVPIPVPAPAPAPVPALPAAVAGKNLDNGGGGGGGGENMLSPSPSRWPKAEVNALIRLRTTLDMKYQESGPKGPLWEEISAAMRKLGYNRNAKRCKEKWENINKYYKKVKESSKKRPEDSKTCPYFHQLDAIYREKANSSTNNPASASASASFIVKPEATTTTQMAPIMARPEQQWPLPAAAATTVQDHHNQSQQQQQQPRESTAMDDRESENADQHNEDDYDEDDEEEEEDEGGEYEIVPNKSSSMATTVE